MRCIVAISHSILERRSVEDESISNTSVAKQPETA